MKKLLLSLLVIMTVQANAQLKAVAYKDGSQNLNGFSIAPEQPNKKKAGVLILPAWMA
jgi:hypothetical protein